MKAMVLRRIVSLNEERAPLRLADLPVPEPRSGEILVKVSACGVCHTELDEIEGRTAPPRLPVRFQLRPDAASTRKTRARGR